MRNDRQKPNRGTETQCVIIGIHVELATTRNSCGDLNDVRWVPGKDSGNLNSEGIGIGDYHPFTARSCKRKRSLQDERTTSVWPNRHERIITQELEQADGLLPICCQSRLQGFGGFWGS